MLFFLKFNYGVGAAMLLIMFMFGSIAHSQELSDKMEDSLIIHSGGIDELPKITSTLVDQLPQKKIYLMNELHWVRMNNLIRHDLIKLFHQKRNVNCFLLEINHSFAFGMNLFLKYGDTKILADFDGYTQSNMIDTAKFYTKIKDLYHYNQQQTAANRLRYVGIDFEMDKNRTRDYVLAMGYFLKIGNDKLPLPIADILKGIKRSDIGNVKYLITQNKKLLIETQKYRKEIAMALEDMFADYLMVINAPTSIPSGRRDGDMMGTLNYAVTVLQETKAVKAPVFMGSFGKAHVFPEDNNSFSSLVQKSGYFKNSTSLIGVQYIDCISRYKNGTVNLIANDGLSVRNKSTNTWISFYLKQISEKVNKPVILLDKLKYANHEYFKNYDAILIYTGI